MLNSNYNSFSILFIIFITFGLLISCNKNDKPDAPTINYSWIPVGYQLPVGNVDELNSPFNIFFIDGQSGFLSHSGMDGYSFARTDDSCTTFIDLSDQVDGYVKEICFPDDQTGYFVTDNYSLFKTIDQGESWNKIESNDLSKVIQVGSNQPENIFIINEDSNDSYSFLYSNDSGISWTEYDLELDIFYGLREVKFQFLQNDPTNGFFNNMYSIYRTTNGGVSWDKYFDFTENTPIQHYWFIDTNITYIANPLGIYKTTNKGLSFEKLNSFSANFWQVLSEEEMYISQVVVVQRTFDEFGNLEVMEVDSPTDNEHDKYIRGISFYESEKGYALSASGQVYRTND